MKLILGSSSPFRKQILEKLSLPFACHSPDIDETALADESPQSLVARLALLKAQAISNAHPNSLIIGSDQVATVEGNILGKPHSHANAVKQLTLCSGKAVTFYTSLCLLNNQTQHCQTEVIPFVVQFRTLSAAEIEGYLQKEKPYHCAGSFKSEGLGITLFEKLQGDDPNTLMGLPLIALTRMLAKENINPLT